LLEETGYVADEWSALGRFTVDGNRSCGAAHVYLAQRARQVTEPRSGDLEDMILEHLPLEAALQAVIQGDVCVLSSAAAIGLAINVIARGQT
jgi:ADP-ribose pyrophosphatase